MKLTLSTIFAATLLLMIGCTDNASDNNAFENTNSALEMTPAPAEGTDQATAGSPAAGVKLNPPHGEPGHRCEIAVGAPLDSEPGMPEAQIQPEMPQAQPVVMQEPAKPAQAATRINPPHGEPGHDCAITVSTPLN